MKIPPNNNTHTHIHTLTLKPFFNKKREVHEQKERKSKGINIGDSVAWKAFAIF